MPVIDYIYTGGAWRPHEYGVGPIVLGGRDGLVAGVHKPTPSTVGVPAGTTLTEQGTGIAMNLTPGTYTDRVFLGRVNIPAGSAAYTFRNCIFAGNDPNGSDSGGSVITATASGTKPPVTLIDCTIDPSYWMTAKGRTKIWPELNGIIGGNVNVQRCEIKNVCDAVAIHGQGYGFTIELSWLHKGTYATGSANTGHSDQRVHSDAIQFHTGKNIVIRGNVIGGMRDMVGYQTSPFADCFNSGDDFENSGLMIKQEVSGNETDRIDNVLIDRNWIYGGQCGINFAYNPARPNTFASTTITGNVFGVRGTGWGAIRQMNGTLSTGNGFYLLRSAILAATIAGNILETGSPVPVSNG